MEFFFEILFEVIPEGIFGLTVKNPKAKTWIKTAVFLLISEAVAGLFLWLSFVGDVDGILVVCLIAIALGIGFLAMAIDGHKRNWK